MNRNGGTARKTYNLPARLIDRVRKILHAKTETEAIVRSLERIDFMEKVGRALRATGGKLPEYRSLR